MRARDFLKDDPLKPHRLKDVAQFALSGHRMGPGRAKVTIVEFADYQCPFCQQVDPVIVAIHERYPLDVAIVYRHFPIPGHDSAMAAARVAECAAKVGDFESFHHHLFENAKQIGQKSWHWFAEGAGVRDLKGFDLCVNGNETFPSIGQDRIAGEQLGVQATPTFLINDLRVTGYIPLEEFNSYVLKALDAAHASD